MRRLLLVGSFVAGALVLASSSAQAQYNCYRCQTPDGGCVFPLYQGWTNCGGVGENCSVSGDECYPNQWCNPSCYSDIQKPAKSAAAVRLANKRIRRQQRVPRIAPTEG